MFDELIDRLSVERDELITEVRNGSANHHFSNVLIGSNIDECLKSMQSLTGSKIHELINTSSDK